MDYRVASHPENIQRKELNMEFGEYLFAVTQQIIGKAEEIFESAGIPRTIQPVVMQGVQAHFLQVAYDNAIAIKLAQSQKAKHPDPGQTPTTRSGEGLDSLQQSLDQDFGRRGEEQ